MAPVRWVLFGKRNCCGWTCRFSFPKQTLQTLQKVLFEILSAYGTCGLSLGFECGAWDAKDYVWCLNVGGSVLSLGISSKYKLKPYVQNCRGRKHFCTSGARKQSDKTFWGTRPSPSAVFGVVALVLSLVWRRPSGPVGWIFTLILWIRSWGWWRWSRCLWLRMLFS